MRNVSRAGVDYVGADIVADLIAQNNARYAGPGVKFQQLNLTEDQLPKVDVVLCRDCLVHLPNNDVIAALKNICKSGSTYLLATTFPRDIKNVDIAAGQWRFLNLTLAPFNLPEPIELIVEGCTVKNGAHSDKSLGLWRVEDIDRALQSTSN
jgi:Methyltransferase domain